MSIYDVKITYLNEDTDIFVVEEEYLYDSFYINEATCLLIKDILGNVKLISLKAISNIDYQIRN